MLKYIHQQTKHVIVLSIYLKMELIIRFSDQYSIQVCHVKPPRFKYLFKCFNNNRLLCAWVVAKSSHTSLFFLHIYSICSLYLKHITVEWILISSSWMYDEWIKPFSSNYSSLPQNFLILKLLYWMKSFIGKMHSSVKLKQKWKGDEKKEYFLYERCRTDI